MRIVAIVLNLALLLFSALLALGGEMNLEGPYVSFFGLIVIAPLISLLALFLRGPGTKDWLARYMERKAWEERQKLEQRKERLQKQTAP